jgi:hypothetical protein
MFGQARSTDPTIVARSDATIKRSALIPFLAAFDFPEPLQGVADRPATIVAPRTLALLNNPGRGIVGLGLRQTFDHQ